jgi:hypothetical protein
LDDLSGVAHIRSLPSALRLGGRNLARDLT